MERMKILFYGTDRSDSQHHTIEAFLNIFDEIFIEINNENSYNGLDSQFICLNKETAIKLVKELKKAIGQLNK
jgi:hypothetical protein